MSFVQSGRLIVAISKRDYRKAEKHHRGDLMISAINEEYPE
jgi:hypothetical protein